MFRFVIGFTGRVGLGSETRLEVMLDTDRDSNTGVQGGEYALDYSSAEEEAAPRPSLLTAQDGDAYGSSPSSLLFSSTPHSVSFQIAAADVGDPSSFDFWVFVEQNGKLVDTAPTHVVVPSPSKPWRYPRGAVPAAGTVYPVERYDDASDTSLTETEIPWRLILLALFGLGALLGIGGYTYDKLHRKPPTKPSITE
jgi:hypothetical protein